LLRLLLLVAGRGGEVLAVGDELVEVEVEGRVRGEWERCGVVTSQMIVFIITGVGRREKPAFIDIAICIKGLWQHESAAEVEASRSWSGSSRAIAGGSDRWDAASHAEEGASADRHCRSGHNIAAGCCVVSGEALTSGAAGASAAGAATVAGSSCSSAASGTGLRAGDRDAGFTVLLGADGRDSRSCSKELAPWPS
jgi:hypothetical protein